NLEGIRAASLAYLGKEPTRLTLGEAGLLVALPQSPEARRPDGGAGQGAAIGRAHVLDRLASLGAIPVGAAALAKRAQLPGRSDLIFAAPHLAERLDRQARAAAPAAQRHAKTLRATFIDPDIQSHARAVLSAGVARWPAGTAAAGMVVRNADCAVIGHVGGTDYFSMDAAGQLDLTRAPRSPGSTLKPLIYGMAFERALLHPETIITDGPRQFSGYEPRNFDTDYAGEMTVREALVRSVNTTAVAVLERLAPHRLLRRLARVGVDYRVPEDARRLGLAIALGGGSVTLADLARLYCGLANEGTARPLRWSQADRPDGSGAVLLDPASAWAITDILAGATPPPGYAGLADAVGDAGARRIAYKTGTSFGYRDAWAVGFDRTHTVAVWLGRPDGAANPKATGWETAAPLLFRLFDALPAPAGDVAGPRPDGHLMGYAATRLPARLRRFGAIGRSVAARARTVQPLSVLFPRAGMVVRVPRARENVRVPRTRENKRISRATGSVGLAYSAPAAGLVGARTNAGDGRADPVQAISRTAQIGRGAGDGFGGSISLTIAGGQPPFTWFIDGKPYKASTAVRSISWRPRGRGAVALTVFDARGAQAEANFWLE
ncbi:MAG: penicillin-binding transpeptidase domain-containing protein, partial [Pseudomonadota bacterium]